MGESAVWDREAITAALDRLEAAQAELASLSLDALRRKCSRRRIGWRHGDRFRQQSGVENLIIYTRIGLVLIVGGCQPCERGNMWAADARITAVTAISAAHGVAEWSCGGSDRVKRTNSVG
jgi:hypothetical protein